MPLSSTRQTHKHGDGPKAFPGKRRHAGLFPGLSSLLKPASLDAVYLQAEDLAAGDWGRKAESEVPD